MNFVRFVSLTLTMALGCFFSSTSLADTLPLSKAEAFLEKGMAHLKAKGKDVAFEDFNKPDGPFVDGELYFYAYDMQGNCLVLGVNPKLVGKNLLELKSSNGVFQIKELIAQISAKGTANVEAEFTNPTTKKVQPKILLAKKIPGFDGFLGTGVYR
jgi:cytochrome c